jgi:hypothetical protein
MDALFGIDPGSATAVYHKARKLLAAWGFTDGYNGLWAEALQENAGTSPFVFDSRIDFIIGSIQDMFSTLDPFSISAASTDEEDGKRAELLLALCDRISSYMAKLTGYQRLIYETGLKAINGVIKAVVKRNGEGQEPKGFDDFFHLWLHDCEKDYQILFASKEFTKLHGELIDAAMNVRILTVALTELHLSHTPLVVRSEIDDLYKTMHDLKREVRALKKERQGLKRIQSRSKKQRGVPQK